MDRGKIMRIKRALGIGLATIGLLGGSVSVVSAAETAPTYAQQLVEYKAALTQYRVTVALNDIKDRAAVEKYWTDWQATLATYQAKWKAEIDKYYADHNAWLAKNKPLNLARKTALDKADADFVAANAAATTPAQQELALKARTTANAAAIAAYKTAVAAIGTEPVAPTKPAELTKPALPAKTADPVKPVAPVKPAVTPKATAKASPKATTTK
jgi:hypothetical protein